MALKITFLGTNGWYPTKLSNTICTLLEFDSRYIVLDAGDGFSKFSDYARNPNKPADIFISHFHLDHIIGLHTLAKIKRETMIRIYGQPGTARTLNLIINHPFTAPVSELKAKVEFLDLAEGKNRIDSYEVTALPLVHADPCFGYRIQIEGQAIAYCADTGPCENIGRLAKNADCLIIECTYPYRTKTAEKWPHLNPEFCAKTAREANCRQLILTHFEAGVFDTIKKRKAALATAQKIFPNTIAGGL